LTFDTNSRSEFERLLQKSNRIHIPEFKKIFEYVFEYSALVIVYRLYIQIFPKYSNISKKVFEYSKSRRKMDDEQKHDGYRVSYFFNV
jgi:hypothetical protein